MKKIILLVFVTLFCCVGYSQAQTTKKMTRQEKKEAQKAMEQALFEEARQAIENKGKHSASCVFFSPLFLPTFVASL